MDCNRVSAVLVLIFCALQGGFDLPAYSAPAKKPQSQPLKPVAGPNYSQAYGAYLNRLRAKINSSWNLPDGKNRVVISAVVQSDGTTSDVNISSAPKNGKAEEAANEAFTKSQPFEPLPTGTAPTAKITFTFDSTSTQHDSSSAINMRMDPITPPPAATGQ